MLIKLSVSEIMLLSGPITFIQFLSKSITPSDAVKVSAIKLLLVLALVTLSDVMVIVGPDVEAKPSTNLLFLGINFPSILYIIYIYIIK